MILMAKKAHKTGKRSYYSISTIGAFL